MRNYIKSICLFTVCGLSFATYGGALTPVGEAFYAKYKKSVSHTYKYKASDPNYSKDYSYDYPKNASGTRYTVDQLTRMIDFGGWGVINYQDPSNDHTSFYLVEFTPNIFIRYKDQFLWAAQVEFSLNDDGTTNTDLQFAYLDWYILPCLTLEGGKFFSPLGKFVNTYYIPYLNKLPTSPAGFGYWEAAPERDIGIQAIAKFKLNEKDMRINAFVANGPRFYIYSTNTYNYPAADGFADTDGHKVFGARIGYFPLPNLELGLSGSMGQVGLYYRSSTEETARAYHSLGFDISYFCDNLTFLAEFVQQVVGSKSTSVVPESAHFNAWYAQLSYLLKEKWEPVIRVGQYHTPNNNYALDQYALGLDYWFTKTIVAKVAYEINNGKVSSSSDNIIYLQFVYGF